jgi:hypothetical protein
MRSKLVVLVSVLLSSFSIEAQQPPPVSGAAVLQSAGAALAKTAISDITLSGTVTAQPDRIMKMAVRGPTKDDCLCGHEDRVHEAGSWTLHKRYK